MTGTKHTNEIAAATDKVLANIASLLEPIEQILRGEKPQHYPDALREQMERMSEDDFLIESVDSYLTRADEIPSAGLNNLKGMTAINPVSSMLRTRRDNILAVTRPHSIHNFKILGWDQFYRQNLDDPEHDPMHMAEQADALILTRSDLHGLRQMLHILRAKLEGDQRVMPTRLIIQDTHSSLYDSFWRPVFDHLNLPILESLVHEIDLHVTHFPGAKDADAAESTLHALREMGIRGMRPAQPSKMDAEVNPGDRLYVCSGSPHKPIEVRDIFSAMKAKIDVMPLNSAIDIKPREAEEDNHSLEGNNWQKMEETRKRIIDDYDTAKAKLCPPGRGPENTWFMWDDRAMGFEDARIMKTKAFAKAAPLMNPYPHKLMPGAELASVFKNFGRKRIFQEMLSEAQQEIYEQSGEWPSTTIVDTACYIMIRMDWLLEENPKYIATFGNTRSTALTQPRPFKPDAQFTEYYSAPDAFNDADTPVGELRTKKEIPYYLETASEMFLALRTVADLTGIDKHACLVAHEYNKAANPEDRNPKQRYNLATLHTLFPHIQGHGTPHMHRVIKGAMNGVWQFLKNRGGQYDVTPYIKPNVKGVVPVRCGTAHRDMAEKALNCLARLYRDADAVILTPDNKKLAEIPGIEWLKLTVYYSMMVGKQVDTRTIKPKFFGVLDQADGSWDNAKKIFDHLNATPLLQNYYEHLIADTDSKSDLKTALRHHAFTYRRPEVVKKPVMMKPDSQPVPDDMYRVTIYCSASLGSETNAYNEALDFTENLAERGFALIQGGGREGVMFATAEGVHRHIRKFKEKFGSDKNPRAHVASEQCHDTYEREGGWHDENHFARIHELIEERMANLMNTDAEILLAGGAGSIQEIAASLLMRAWRITPSTHRPLIIVNQMVDGCPVFDPLINMISAQERAELNVHVVANTSEAMAVLEKSRAGLRKVMGEDAIYIPGMAEKRAAKAEPARNVVVLRA